MKTIYCRPTSILSNCLDSLPAEPSPELINNLLLDELYMLYKEYELFKERYLKRRKWKHCTNRGCIVWSWCVIKPWFTRICKKMILTYSLVVGSFYLFTLQCTKITNYPRFEFPFVEVSSSIYLLQLCIALILLSECKIMQSILSFIFLSFMWKQ